MTTTLRGVEEKLRKYCIFVLTSLITDMGNNDEGLMNFCLELNDDLLKVILFIQLLDFYSIWSIEEA